ncbi:MAG: tRNA lysidine(34) synthetase TilS [Flavobacteriaceae bacterium]|jgi:tRNA(Ile)-lysidine synthase|nr:tRNA lysidine(34) synthetase TilS [Flavobacteriaceae bacterium]MBT6169788.1 tRNA lysidine(34) synthetase TilS [Flavobacteriaceae bacterium]MDG1830995.1 tRNA lysidine(34) synthetase TilS [Flavobacteriaceae bacterium]
MYNLFSKHIKKEFSFLKESKLLVCVSGGVDSMVLINLLNRLKYNVSIAHCNFNLRDDESDIDEDFVKNYAITNSIPFFSKSFITRIPKHSMQMAARNLRYKWFYSVLKVEELDYIITAHHLDDSLETFILNLSRASGIEGLAGIKQLNDIIVRPLLIFSKNEILNYAKTNNIKWREDSTNKKNDYQRNQIRNEIIPLLKKLHPNFLDQSKKTMTFLKESNLIIENYIQIIKNENFNLKDDEIFISKDFIKNNSNLIFHLFKEYNFKYSDQILELCNSLSGKIIESNTHVLLSNRSNLVVKEKTNRIDQTFEVGIKGLLSPIEMNIEVGEFKTKFNKKSIYLSKKEIDFPLYLRKWKKGDVFFPFGMKGKKTVSKYYKDEKMSFFDKQNQWLLCNNDEIVWVVGKRPDRRFFKDNNASLKIEVL